MKEKMSNLYKIKWEEEESNYKKEERMKVEGRERLEKV